MSLAVKRKQRRGQPQKCVRINITLPPVLIEAMDGEPHPDGRSGIIRDLLAHRYRMPEAKTILSGGRGHKADENGK